MDHDYENMFNNCDEGSYINIFRDQSHEFQNLFNNKNDCYSVEMGKDLEIPVEEFKIDKSDTKSHTKTASPKYHFDVNNFYQSEEGNTLNNSGEISENYQKIFKIEKDQEKIKSKNINKENIHKSHLTISERMRIKKEKAKMLLGEKKRRECETDEGSVCHSSQDQNYSTASNKDYIIDEDKLISFNDKMDEIKKKEIKILRNRMSAQKSRDRRKKELEDLRILSNNFFAENNLLRNKLSEAERELNLLKQKMKNCPKCKEENILQLNTPYVNNNVLPLQSNTIITTNSNRNHNTSINNMSISSRSNFSGRSKIGLFTGLFLVVFLIGCLLLSPINENKLRVLQSLPEPDKNYNKLSKEKNNTAVVEFPLKELNKNSTPLNPKNLPVKKKDHPIVLRPSEINNEQYLLGGKRNEFMINIANKLKVAQSIDSISKVHRYYNFRTDNSYKPSNEYCLNSNDVTCNIKDEKNKTHKYIVPKDYFENHLNELEQLNDSKVDDNKDVSIIDNLKGNVESLFCKDYVTTSENINHNFNEIIENKIMKKDLDNTKESDCMYLHMIIPAQGKNKTNDEPLFGNSDKKAKTYFEIGCKIFEINKIYR